MHPAISVICFTVLSGAGYGLLILLCCESLFDLKIQMSNTQRLTLLAISLVLVTVGLISSTFHLANKKNAWRAFFRFRTSWLGSTAEGGSKILAFSALLLACATLFSTGMIYACLKTIRQWNTMLTPANYVMLGLMLGALIMAVFNPAARSIALGTVFVAAVVKIFYFFKIGQPQGPTINTALGFTQASVRLLDVGHGPGNFLTEEFGYEVAKVKLLWLRIISICLAFVLPLLLLWLNSSVATIAALISAATGVFVERWLFFAEARHVVNLYHGSQRT